VNIFDYLKRKKQANETNKDNQTSKSASSKPVIYKIVLDKEKQAEILNEKIEEFFPNSGHWYSNCFRKEKKVSYSNLPCHLRDNEWLGELLYKNLLKDGILIPRSIATEFLTNSERFNELRHNHELEIVKWQINYMKNGGEGWLLPKGYDELSLIFSPNTVEVFRSGVVKTLSAIGMDRVVIEEGIEKNADIFREVYLETGFRNEFDSTVDRFRGLKPADEGHKENWLKAKRYEYYCEHKNSVDKYGTPHPDMQISPEEAEELYATLYKQNEARKEEIENLRANPHNNIIYKPINADEMDK